MSVDTWLEEIDDEKRRPALARLVQGLRSNLPDGFQECVNGAMAAWVVPLSRFPAGYHCTPGTPLPFISLANQKRHIALYHMGLYADPELLAWFEGAYAAEAPTKLNMGKSCIRFTNPKNIPHGVMDALASKVTVDDWVARYEATLKR